jgi:hypothetical protein
MAMAWAYPGKLQAQGTFELAQKAASTIGIGQSGKCQSCHETNSQTTIERWGWQTYKIWRQCLDDDGNPGGTPTEAIHCLNGSEPDDAASIKFDPARLGFLSAGLHLPRFAQLFHQAYGETRGEQLYQQAIQSAEMPRFGFPPLTSREFSDLMLWVRRGMPHLAELLKPYDGPTSCQPKTSNVIHQHVLTMQQNSWQRRNEDEGLMMFGCLPGEAAESCFSQVRDGQKVFADHQRYSWSKDWTDPFPTATIRFLTEIQQKTEYWVRSSADGRFVAYGSEPSVIIDLQAEVTRQHRRRIEVEAYFDPGFFPDNKAFIFQGDGTGLCQQSILYREDVDYIDFSDPLCSIDQSVQVPLYQSIGASLMGSDYWAVTGEFQSDRGDGDMGPTVSLASQDRPQSTPQAHLRIYPIRFDGLSWQRDEPTTFATPWEADWNVSPSNQLMISRLIGRVDKGLQHIGYQLYHIDELNDPEGFGDRIGNPDARLCTRGLKGQFSFNERFFVTYQYVATADYQKLGYDSPTDPAFHKLLSQGAANLILYDLYDGTESVITRVHPGQFMLFPHFRSDGWIYALVYDANRDKRYVVASDAALQTERRRPLN